MLFVQFTNFAAYPPLLHSSELLARAGADVRVLSAVHPNLARLTAPDVAGRFVTSRTVHAPGGRQKLDYARYAAAAVGVAARWRPDWIYASDVMAAPIALAARAVSRARVIYHEHDHPAPAGGSAFMGACFAARRRLFDEADAVVAPNRARADLLTSELGARRVIAVRNVPALAEVAPARVAPPDGALRVLYFGSLSAERLPLAVVEALAGVPRATLTVVGYETLGSVGHADRIREAARAGGVEARVRVLDAMPRGELLRLADACDLGLAVMGATNENMITLAGASVKAFDYLARGLAVAVPAGDAWRELFVQPGYGFAVDPVTTSSMRDFLGWCADHRDDVRRAGERGRARIAAEWNYEREFAAVASLVLGRAGAADSEDAATADTSSGSAALQARLEVLERAGVAGERPRR